MPFSEENKYKKNNEGLFSKNVCPMNSFMPIHMKQPNFDSESIIPNKQKRYLITYKTGSVTWMQVQTQPSFDARGIYNNVLKKLLH